MKPEKSPLWNRINADSSIKERKGNKAGQLSLLSSFIFMFATSSVAADGSQRLDEITIKGEAIDAAQKAFTVNVIDGETIRDLRPGQPLRLIEQVPGVDLGAYRQGGVADVFTIRGFTGAGHGSDAGVALDGISLNQGESHADGYADTNIIIPLELERLSIFKGPVSALHGNYARGGVLDFVSRKGGEYQELDISAGSFGTFDTQAALGATFGSLQTNIALQSYETDGWRDNSRYTKGTAAARFAYDLSEKADVALSLRSHAGQWEGPGYIPESQFNNEDMRKRQSVNAENDGGEKDFFAGRIDYNYLLNDQLKLLLFSYGTKNEFTRFAKFGYEAGGQSERYYDRDVMAFGASLNGVNSLAGSPLNWVAGVEHYNEATQWRRWNTANRTRTAQTQERHFDIDTLSLFGQVDWEISPALRPVVGLRYDRFSGDYENNDPAETPFTHSMNDYDHISPKLGLRSTVSEGIELRGSIANGFALPDGEAKYDPTLAVDTVEYWQYELGATLTTSQDWFVDAAYFMLDSSDEILEEPAGSGTFKNVGETRRSGLEVEARYFTPVDYLEVGLTTALFDSEIQSNPDAQQVGKEITGLPESITTISLDYKPVQGWGGNLSWRQVGEYYLTSDNSESYSGYSVVKAGVFYNTRYDRGRSLSWHMDINNLTNEDYAEAVWFGSGKNYAPAPPANITVGLALKY